MNLSDYKNQMLTILGDLTGRRYTDAMLEMGLREALGTYRAFCPRKETILAPILERDGISLCLNPIKPGVEIVTARIENGKWLNFGTYQTDRRLYLNCYDYSDPLPEAGTRLLLELNLPHTVADLDDASGTTVPETHTLIVCSGAAGHAMRIRARSVTEVFGKRPEDRAALMDQADQMITEYFNQLSRLQPAAYDPLPRGGWDA